MNKTGRRTLRRKAFTLLEVLLSVLLIALILGTIQSSLWLGMQTYRTKRNLSDRDNMIRSALDLLAEDLQSIGSQYPKAYPVLMGKTGNPSGKPGCFLRLRTIDQTIPDERIVDYFFFQQQQKQGLLVRRSQSKRRSPLGDHNASMGSGDPRNAQYEILAEKLIGWEIRYYDGFQWLQTWDSSNGKLPELIEIKLEIFGEDQPETYMHCIPVLVETPLLPAEMGEQAHG